jgi:hypothetical protein
MGFVKLGAPTNFRFETVTDPVFILKTGRNNSVLNRAFVSSIGKKAFDIVKFDLYLDRDAKKVAVKICDDGAWERKVTKSNQIQIWFNSFMEKNGLRFKGDKARYSCPLKYSEKLDMWIFSIPDEAISIGDEKKVVLKKVKKDEVDTRKIKNK